MKYNAQELEKKWQDYWEKEGLKILPAGDVSLPLWQNPHGPR
jgi:hypothetical protein